MNVSCVKVNLRIVSWNAVQQHMLKDPHASTPKDPSSLYRVWHPDSDKAWSVCVV